MSVKSERRAWYAANVKPMPNDDRSSVEWIAWRDEANEHMRKVCKPLTAELLEPAEAPAIAELRAALTGAGSPVKRWASAVAPSSEDRMAFESFVESQLIAFGDHIGAGGPSDDLWNRAKVARSGRSFEPFKGSLRSVRPYLNGDALDALERGVIRWVTFSEFRLERAELRAAEVDAAEDEAESFDAEDCVLCMASSCECDLVEWAA